MGFFKKLIAKADPINQMTPIQVVRSMPSVWVRVPICVFAGYFDNKSNEEEEVDYDALVFSIIGTDIQVYGRESFNIEESPQIQFALNILSRMKEGVEFEKLLDASYVLLLSEMINGGSNITVELGTKSVDLGFTKISKPLMYELFDEEFPISQERYQEISNKAIQKAMIII
jgi:hypothetical protein